MQIINLPDAKIGTEPILRDMIRQVIDELMIEVRENEIKRNEARETAVIAFAVEQPAFGQVRVSNELCKRGIFISPSGVRSVWRHHDLESFKKRLSALERHVAETVCVLTEAQIVALEAKEVTFSI